MAGGAGAFEEGRDIFCVADLGAWGQGGSGGWGGQQAGKRAIGGELSGCFGVSDNFDHAAAGEFADPARFDIGIQADVGGLECGTEGGNAGIETGLQSGEGIDSVEIAVGASEQVGVQKGGAGSGVGAAGWRAAGQRGGEENPPKQARLGKHRQNPLLTKMERARTGRRRRVPG